MTNVIDLHSRVHAQMPDRSVPEAVTVRVLTPNEETAKLVAPLLAKQLHPGRTFGEVLFMEWGPADDDFGPGWDCSVEVFPW